MTKIATSEMTTGGLRLGRYATGTNQRFATSVESWTASIPHFPQTFDWQGGNLMSSDTLPGYTNIQDSDYHTTQSRTGPARRQDQTTLR